MNGAAALRRWVSIRAAAAYLTVVMLANLVWETAQLPLYTIGRTGSRRELLIAVLHCTGGDVLIAAAALAIGSGAARFAGWPPFGLRMAVIVIFSGFAYTIFSEWLNVEIRRSWAYAPAMPVLPPFGTALSPFLQWLVVPALAIAAARRGSGWRR